MSEQQTDNPIRDAIAEAIRDNDVILFMKGTPDAPACGFSARTVAALQATGSPFAAVDILPDPRIRQELSAISDWPTIPQLFVGRRAARRLATSSSRCTRAASSRRRSASRRPRPSRRRRRRPRPPRRRSGSRTACADVPAPWPSPPDRRRAALGRRARCTSSTRPRCPAEEAWLDAHRRRRHGGRDPRASRSGARR